MSAQEEGTPQGSGGLSALADAAWALGEAPVNRQRLFDEAAERLSRLVGDLCVLAMVGDSPGRFEPVAVRHRSESTRRLVEGALAAADLDSAGRWPLARRAVESGEPVLVDEASGGLLEAGSGVAPVCGRAQRQQRPLRPGSGTRTHHRRGRAGPRRRRALLHLRRSWRRESRRDRRRTETERAPQRWCPARPAHRGARPPGRRADRGRGRDRAARRWRRPRGRSGREVTERRRIEREVGLQADVLDQVDAAVKRWNRNGWSCTGTGGPRHPTATPPRRRSVGRCAI